MKKRMYSASVFAVTKYALCGASLVVIGFCGLGDAWAQSSADIGVPADGVAAPVPVDSPSEAAAGTAPVAVQPPQVTTSAPVAVTSPAPVPTQLVAEPVEQPKGGDLATPGGRVEPVAVPPVPVAVSPSDSASVPVAPNEVVKPASEAAVQPKDSPVPAKPKGIAKAEAGFDQDLFYDANDIVPEGELAKKSARKMNPKLEPASKLIVVTKDGGPGSHQAQLVSAGRALKLGRYEAALDIYQALYEKNRKDPQVLMGVAVALQRMGNFDASIAAYQELLDIQPKNTQAEVNMLGLMSEKYPAVALRRLDELRTSNPSDLGVVAQLAVTQAQLNNTQEALKYLAVAASMQPDNPGHVYNMAIIADRAGNRTEAVKYYEQALEMDSVYGGGRGLPRDVIFDRLARLR